MKDMKDMKDEDIQVIDIKVVLVYDKGVLPLPPMSAELVSPPPLLASPPPLLASGVPMLAHVGLFF